MHPCGKLGPNSVCFGSVAKLGKGAVSCDVGFVSMLSY